MDKKGGEIANIHFWEVHPLNRSQLNVRRALKAVTTDKLENTYKLSKKTMGHQFLLLLGAGVIDIHGNEIKTKGKR